MALTGEDSVLRRGVTSGLPVATFRLSRQRCCRRWLWQGLRGLAEAERGHTGTAGGVTVPSGQSRHGTGTSSLPASGSLVPVPCLCQDPGAPPGAHPAPCHSQTASLHSGCAPGRTGWASSAGPRCCSPMGSAASSGLWGERGPQCVSKPPNISLAPSPMAAPGGAAVQFRQSLGTCAALGAPRAQPRWGGAPTALHGA